MPTKAVTAPVSEIKSSVRPVARGMTFCIRCGQSPPPPEIASQAIAMIGISTMTDVNPAHVASRGCERPVPARAWRRLML
ncbi:hypothetical protein N182_05995 [Sinorhizobium sp. GL2]|nr:hypothetical protein N182_05995 [Sinorhizobium sp. GL2]